jgi:hypothetical protein
MAAATPTTGAAQACSKPRNVCPATVQAVMSTVKYHRANRRRRGLRRGYRYNVAIVSVIFIVAYLP